MRLKIWGKGLLKIIWVIFVILLVGLSFPQIYGMKCYSVMSGSMSPDLPVAGKSRKRGDHYIYHRTRENNDYTPGS